MESCKYNIWISVSSSRVFGVEFSSCYLGHVTRTGPTPENVAIISNPVDIYMTLPSTK